MAIAASKLFKKIHKNTTQFILMHCIMPADSRLAFPVFTVMATCCAVSNAG